ncbi:hypothetical protein EDB85DRAFT_1960315 [Lactarius pseudohatsudake]|nr:hypothetical protein EDB85DRAFT_1960315 [Lactarius pseudohatsudake]
MTGIYRYGTCCKVNIKFKAHSVGLRRTACSRRKGKGDTLAEPSLLPSMSSSSYRYPSKATTGNHPFSPPSRTVSPHSSSCTTSTSTYDPSSSNDKTRNIYESFCKEPEKIQVRVLGKSHRPVKNINMLPDNVFLEIFDFYRMYPESLYPPLLKTSWKWYGLVHVCQDGGLGHLVVSM